MKYLLAICALFLTLLCNAQDKGKTGIPVLRLNSTSYQNGYHHGQKMKAEIHELHALWKQNLEATYGYNADDIISSFLETTNFIPAIEKWTPQLLDEIQGISDGSGIDFNTTLAFQLVDEMWTSENIITEPHHCSSLGFNNYILDGGDNLIAQNLDVPVFYHGYEVLLHISDTITGSQKLVSTFAGFIGANGLNNDIGVCVNALLDLKNSTKGLPVCCVVRGILEKKSFAGAKSFIYSIEHASGQNYMIGSREEIASFECASDLVVEFWPDSNMSYTFHTNTPYANNSFKDSYASRMRKQFQAEPEDVHLACPRFEMIEEFVNRSDKLNSKSIIEILAKKPVYNRYTWLSTIMTFEDHGNDLYIAPSCDPNGKYYKFEIR